MPALSLLAVIGIAALSSGANETLKRARLPAATLFVGGAIVLATVGITERYLHDFYPALIICAAAGITRLGSSPHIRTINALAAGLTAVSIVLNCSFSLINQREGLGAPDTKVLEYRQLQERVDSLKQRLFSDD
jgi:hypothetical protein